jgi:hypothetical protein
MENGQQYKRQQQQNQQTRRRPFYHEMTLDVLEDEKHYSFSGSNKKIVVKEDNKNDTTTHNSHIVLQQQEGEFKEGNCTIPSSWNRSGNSNSEHRQILGTNATDFENRQLQNHEFHSDDSANSVNENSSEDIVDGDDENDSINVGTLLTKSNNLIPNRSNCLEATSFTTINDWEDSFQCEIALLDLESSIDPLSLSSISLKKDSSLEYPSTNINDAANNSDVPLHHRANNSIETATTATLSLPNVLFPSLSDVEEVSEPDCQVVFRTIDNDNVDAFEKLQSSSRFLEYNGIQYQDEGYNSLDANKTSHSSTSNTDFYDKLFLKQQDLCSVDELNAGESYENVPALGSLEYRLIQQNQNQQPNRLYPNISHGMDRRPSYDENDFELEYVYQQSLRDHHQRNPQDRIHIDGDINSRVSTTTMSRQGIDQFGLYPEQSLPYRPSVITSYVSDHHLAQQQYQQFPHLGPGNASRFYNNSTNDSISNNTRNNRHHQYQPDNDIDHRIVSNRFYTQMNVNNPSNCYNISSSYDEQDLIYQRRSSYSSKDSTTKYPNRNNSFSSDNSNNYIGEYSRYNHSMINNGSPASSSSLHNRTTAMFDNVRLAAVSAAGSTYCDNDNNKKSDIQIEVSPGVFLPLHGSEETQQAMYEAILKSYNKSLSCSINNDDKTNGKSEQFSVNANDTTNGLVKCTCLSCAITVYCIEKAVAVVCYKCLEVSPITTQTNTNKATDNTDDNKTTDTITLKVNQNRQEEMHGIGLGISEQSYLDLVSQITKRFNKDLSTSYNLNASSPTRVRKISLLPMGQNIE